MRSYVLVEQGTANAEVVVRIAHADPAAPDKIAARRHEAHSGRLCAAHVVNKNRLAHVIWVFPVIQRARRRRIELASYQSRPPVVFLPQRGGVASIQDDKYIIKQESDFPSVKSKPFRISQWEILILPNIFGRQETSFRRSFASEKGFGCGWSSCLELCSGKRAESVVCRRRLLPPTLRSRGTTSRCSSAAGVLPPCG